MALVIDPDAVRIRERDSDNEPPRLHQTAPAKQSRRPQTVSTGGGSRREPSGISRRGRHRNKPQYESEFVGRHVDFYA